MITDADKLECAARELSFRRKVYPRQIKYGRMTQAQADREIAIMESILDDYRARIKTEWETRFTGRLL
jgi:hypothetical protein